MMCNLFLLYLISEHAILRRDCCSQAPRSKAPSPKVMRPNPPGSPAYSQQSGYPTSYPAYQKGSCYETPLGLGLCGQSWQTSGLRPGWYVNMGTFTYPQWVWMAAEIWQPRSRQTHFRGRLNPSTFNHSSFARTW